MLVRLVEALLINTEDHTSPQKVVDDAKHLVMNEMERIVASSDFIRSKSLCRFLRYAVSESLLDHEEKLKEYNVGVLVFNRGESFNPGADPIVRVQARRLRQKLEQYYDAGGRDAPVRIVLPKGSYAAQFLARAEPEPGRGIHQKPIAKTPSIAVLPFSDFNHDLENETFCEGLTDQLIHALARRGDLLVVSRTSSSQFKGTRDDVSSIARRLNAATLVEGGVLREGGRRRITAHLTDAESGYHVWSGQMEEETNDVLKSQERLSRDLACHLRARLLPGESSGDMALHAVRE